MVLVTSRLWTRDELIEVLKLYCVTPFGRLHSRNPEIQRLAEDLQRTPSAVALKMTNFASLDPTIARAGMSNHSKLDKAVWDEFFQNMDKFVGANERLASGGEMSEPQVDFIYEAREGLDVLRTVKTRVNQNFFRKLILASYDNKCALTGIDAPELLVASHIIPWSANEGARTNPTNGICLNALHDRAFDEGFISFDQNYSVLYSPKLPSETKGALMSFGAEKLRLPTRFIPDQKFLDFHRSEVFLR
jgi:putative restriction endonuclease